MKKYEKFEDENGRKDYGVAVKCSNGCPWILYDIMGTPYCLKEQYKQCSKDD